MNKGLTTREAAERLHISPARVRRLILDGRLPAQKFGRDLVIYEADLESFERLKGGRPPGLKTSSPVAGKPVAGRNSNGNATGEKRGGRK